MKPEITIRPYLESDRDEVVNGLSDLQEVERAISDFCLTSIQVGEKYLDYLLMLNAKNSGIIIVARIEDKLIGFIACRIETDESVTTKEEMNTFGYISDAWTHIDYRKQGVFKQLNEEAEKYLRRFRDIKIVKLNALAKNSPAISAYEKAGYETYELTLLKKL